MAKAPIKEATFTKQELADIATLAQLQAQLDDIKTKEMALRKKVFAATAAKIDLKTGTNNIALPEDWKLKVVAKETVSVEESLLPAVQEKMREAGIREDVFKFKPSLVTANYKALTPEQRKVIDEALLIKPASPEVKIIAPIGV